MREWLQATVDDFWDAAGGAGRFPRNIEEAVLWALPLAVLKFPRLGVGAVETWLADRGISFRVGVADRPLRGCLVAHAGKGVVFLDGTDQDDDQRFTVAHEGAHFLVDYLSPRERAITKFGLSIVQVLDGIRPPTPAERVDALLGLVTIGVHAHLMERAPDGTLGCAHVAGAEGRADRLALELLAPADVVRKRVERHDLPAVYDEGLRRTLDVLTGTFRLPLSVADRYARWLCRGWYGGPSVREWLKV